MNAIERALRRAGFAKTEPAFWRCQPLRASAVAWPLGITVYHNLGSNLESLYYVAQGVGENDAIYEARAAAGVSIAIKRLRKRLGVQAWPA